MLLKPEITVNCLGWLVTYRNKCSAPGIEPGAGTENQHVKRLLIVVCVQSFTFMLLGNVVD